MMNLDEYGIDRTGNWLQLFAGPKKDDIDDDDVVEDPDGEDIDTDLDDDTADDDLDDADLEDDEDEEESDDQGDDGEDDEEDEEDEDSEGPQDKTPKAKGDESEAKEKLIPQSKVQAQIKDRLARQARSFQRKIKELEEELERVKGKTFDDLRDAAGVDIDEDEAVDALKFWAYLKANPDHAAAFNRYLQANPWKNHPVVTKSYRNRDVDPEDLEKRLEEKLEYRETLRELRQDPIFKKYEAQIMEYAEDEGFDISTAKGLRQAFKAWRGENLRLIAAEARRQGVKEAKTSKAKAKNATLIKASGGRLTVKGDPSKMSDLEFLRRHGLSLFTDD